MRWRIAIPALLIAFFIFLPQLLSTPPGTFLAEKILQKKTKADIKLDSLSLSWLGPQTAKGVQISDASLYVSCKEFTAYRPLWSFAHIRGLFTVKNGYLRVKSPSGEEALFESVDAKIDGSQFV